MSKPEHARFVEGNSWLYEYPGYYRSCNNIIAVGEMTH